MPTRFIRGFCLLLIFFGTIRAAEAEPLLRPEDRIVFVGDSITGRGGNAKDGWVALIGRALKENDPANRQTLVPLGGSGQTVGSWKNVERKSRSASTILDVKAFDARVELGRPADVIVIMLGMNDVLSPSLEDREESYQKWIGNYRSLIVALRERCTPRLVALATPTPCTEDPLSPKNRVMDKMCACLAELAKQENCVLLPTREASWEMLALGRRAKPDFHILADQVHPNHYGHAAIAAGMLRGMGEPRAADRLLERAKTELFPPGATPLSYEIAGLPEPRDHRLLRFRIRAFHSGGKAELELPESWTLVKTAAEKGGTLFVVDGIPDREVNRLVLRCGGSSREIAIPAPWLVGTGNIGRHGWKGGGKYDPEAGRLPADETVRTGADFAKAMDKLELKPGTPVTWKHYLGGVNYGGGGKAGVVDFAEATYFTGGEIGYGLRWIRSDRERPAGLKVGQPGFAGMSHLEVWLNGAAAYAGNPRSAGDKAVPVTLKAGWNLLSFKSNFSQWQWQVALDLTAVDGGTLEPLRYSTFAP